MTGPAQAAVMTGVLLMIIIQSKSPFPNYNDTTAARRRGINAPRKKTTPTKVALDLELE